MSACEQTVSRAASGSGGGETMERQLGKLESDVEHIKTDVSGLRADLREFRSEIRSEIGELRSETHSEVGKLRDLHERDFRVLFGAIIVVAIGIASIMAKAFGWLK